MAEKLDAIGIVRQHRWVSADKQAEMLKPQCRTVVSLGGGKVRRITRETIEKWSTPGRIFAFVHAFLLAEPSRRRLAGGLKADFRATLARIEKRGGIVFDATGGKGSANKSHTKALLALVDADIDRSNRGSRSSANGARSRGRPKYQPSAQELQAGKLVWRDLDEYREWPDADAALRKINPKFTAWRAHEAETEDTIGELRCITQNLGALRGRSTEKAWGMTAYPTSWMRTVSPLQR